jgi:DNA-binding CsgD family transcriptional regulator
VGQPVTIDEARQAVARESWTEAYETSKALDPSTLTAADLEGYADAAWWLSHLRESLEIRQRAYAAYAAEGDDYHAGATAGRLAVEHFIRDEPAVGGGFLMRAQRHLRSIPDGPAHGFMALLEATVARFTGRLDEALATLAGAIEVGRRFGDRDLIAMSIHTQGLVLLDLGRTAEGLALMDEAMASVIAGELSAYWTGIIYCSLIDACLEISDLRRAGEWSDAAQTWCEALPVGSSFPGVCRANRAQLARLRGAWAEAEAAALRASEELLPIEPGLAAPAFRQVGEVRLRAGNLAGAEQAFARAHELGSDPQPGLAFVRSAQGKVETARTAVRASLEGERPGPQRARLLAAQVEFAVTAEDVDEATRAAEELEAMAETTGTQLYVAMAASTTGSVALAKGDVGPALARLRRASAAWQNLRLPYETARARVLYGRALRASGDEDGAQLELRAALATFERLGAALDVVSTSSLLREPGGLPDGLTAREAEVLRLVASGKTNKDIAVELVISEHTVARHLQNMFAKLGVSSRAGATAYAYEHGLA